MRLQPAREDMVALGVSPGTDEHPYDKDFSAIRQKARRVLDGSASFSKREADLILARLIVEGASG